MTSKYTSNTLEKLKELIDTGTIESFGSIKFGNKLLVGIKSIKVEGQIIIIEGPINTYKRSYEELLEMVDKREFTIFD